MTCLRRWTQLLQQSFLSVPKKGDTYRGVLIQNPNGDTSPRRVDVIRRHLTVEDQAKSLVYITDKCIKPASILIGGRCRPCPVGAECPGGGRVRTHACARTRARACTHANMPTCSTTEFCCANRILPETGMHACIDSSSAGMASGRILDNGYTDACVHAHTQCMHTTSGHAYACMQAHGHTYAP